MLKIGFIGLGHMGLPMAINLVKAGHQVTGFDLQAEPLMKLINARGRTADSIEEFSAQQDVLITMLQTGKQVQEVCIGTKGLFANALPKTLYIDCSTIDVPTSREIHQLAQEFQLLSLDAPVSGGVLGAAAGTLTFMVGGSVEGFNQAQPILAAMGQKIIHTGSASSGQAAKICNNMVLGVSMIAVSEAFILAEQLGLSAKNLLEVLSNSSGQCWVTNKYVPLPGLLEQVPANNDYKPGFAANMMLKDLILSQNSAKTAKVKTPLGEKATQLYQNLIDQGGGQYDFSAIIRLLAEVKEN